MVEKENVTSVLVTFYYLQIQRMSLISPMAQTASALFSASIEVTRFLSYILFLL